MLPHVLSAYGFFKRQREVREIGLRARSHSNLPGKSTRRIVIVSEPVQPTAVATAMCGFDPGADSGASVCGDQTPIRLRADRAGQRFAGSKPF